MQQSEVKLKIELNGEVRRATLIERSFEGLQKQVSQLFSFQDANFTMKYKDDEGDLVTISSQEELQEALCSLQQNLLRLKLTKLKEEERGGRCGRFRNWRENLKNWKQTQKKEEGKEDKEEKEEKEENVPWKRIFIFKSPNGFQHPRFGFPHPPHHHHFHHRDHHREEEKGQQEGQDHSFVFPPRFHPPHHHHFNHRHHHHREHQQNEEAPRHPFVFPPRFRPSHHHHFNHHHREHQQNEEAPRFGFPPRHPFGFFPRPPHHHHHHHREQNEEAHPFGFVHNLQNLAKKVVGEVLKGGESSLEELLNSGLFKVEQNYLCDGCDEPISGSRHHCTECPDFDFCSSCFETKINSHPQHNFEKITAFEALKEALENEQQIDAFFVNKNAQPNKEEEPNKKQEEKPVQKESEEKKEEQKMESSQQEQKIEEINIPQQNESNISFESSSSISSSTTTESTTETPLKEKPSNEESIVYPFQKKLEDLEVMGFTDRKKNILALLQNKGNVELAIEQLLN